MNFLNLAKAMPSLLDTGISYELISAPGRGKSEFIHDQIKINELRTGVSWGFATCFLATMTPSDLLGYMIPGHDNKGRRISEFTSPPWMRTVDGNNVEDYPRGILFLDEYGQGESDVKRASAELLLNRKLGPWQLPPGWSVIAASNRAKDRSGVTKSFDFVTNRRCEIHIDDDPESWEAWAIEKKVDPLLITFAKNNPQIVFADGVPEKQGPWCTPRSLVMAGNILNQLRQRDENGQPTGQLPDDEIAIQLVSGMIGEGATHQLFATVRLANNMPAYEDILSNPTTCKVPDAPDAMMMVIYTLAARTKMEELGAITQYVARFPVEFLTMWAKAATKYCPNAPRDKSFSVLYMKHASLFNSVIGSSAK